MALETALSQEIRTIRALNYQREDTTELASGDTIDPKSAWNTMPAYTASHITSLEVESYAFVN